MQPTQPTVNQDVTTQTSQDPLPLSLPVLSAPETEKEELLVSASAHNRELVFDVVSASLKKIIFFDFGEYSFDLDQSFALLGQNLVFTQQKCDSQQAVFVYQDEQQRIIKRFDYSNPNGDITLDIETENLSEAFLPYSSNLSLGVFDLESRDISSRYQEVFFRQSQGMQRVSPRRATKEQQPGDFFGFRNPHFCIVVIPVLSPETIQVAQYHCKPGMFGKACKTSQAYLSHADTNIPPGQIEHSQYEIYVGPQDSAMLKAFNPGAEEVVFYGKLDIFVRSFLRLLRFLSRHTHNWGWAIILFGTIISFALLPLTVKQIRSMVATQRLQPQVAELNRRYKDNPQRAHKETLELYRKNKINPFAGCLPLILQMPVFISIYQTLMRVWELKGAHFLWIKDLSQPDRLIASPEINVIPILMAGTMFLQQKFTMPSAAGSGAGSEQQKMMSFIFPIMFGVIFYKMPSGLVLCWFVNSTLMFIFQMRVKKALAKAE